MAKLFAVGRRTINALLSATVLYFIVCVALGLPESINAASIPRLDHSLVISRRDDDPDFENIDEDKVAEWAQNIKCYALPYGLVGFVGHLHTYYTMFCLFHRRRPLMPWKALDGKPFDLGLAAAQGIVTVVLTAINIHRCDYSWQLMSISAWKMLLTIEVSLNTVVAYFRAGGDEKEGKGPIICLAYVYWFACLPALAGLVSIQEEIGVSPVVGMVNPTADACQIIAICFFAGFAILYALLTVFNFDVVNWLKPASIKWNSGNGSDISTSGGILFFLIGGVYSLGVAFALYSDWVLGEIAADIFGVKVSRELQAPYWIYFLFKRLPFFAF